jgi:hypothetical protein
MSSSARRSQCKVLPLAGRYNARLEEAEGTIGKGDFGLRKITNERKIFEPCPIRF